MATKFYPTNTASGLSIASEADRLATLAQGAALKASDANLTVAGPTAGVQCIEQDAPGEVLAWYTNGLNAVTISGTVTFNVWMSENNMSANVCARIKVQRCNSAGGVISTIIDAQNGVVEIAVTTRAVNNWTGTPTSTTLSTGDRLRITISGDDAGTMATGFVFAMSFGGPTAAADGDTWVQFNETITEGSAAAGSLLLPNLNRMVVRR